MIRADAAGASHWFTEECRDRNLEFAIGYYIDDRIRDAVLLTQEEAWLVAIEPGGKIRDGAEVAELTEFVDLSGAAI